MSCSVIDGILGLLVRVYIIAFIVDVAYKHTKRWCKSSQSDDVPLIYYECTLESSTIGILDGTMSGCNPVVVAN
jgi:hypothetical protein